LFLECKSSILGLAVGEDVRVPCGMGMVKRKVANGKRRVESHKVGKNEVQNQPPEHYQAEQRLVDFK
jgi:hypothetical protein